MVKMLMIGRPCQIDDLVNHLSELEITAFSNAITSTRYKY